MHLLPLSKIINTSELLGVKAAVGVLKYSYSICASEYSLYQHTGKMTADLETGTQKTVSCARNIQVFFCPPTGIPQS